MAKPIGEMNEWDCLSVLVAGLIGVDANGFPNFQYPATQGGGTTSSGTTNGKTLANMNEVDMLRLLVAGLVGVDATTGAPKFNYPAFQ